MSRRSGLGGVTKVYRRDATNLGPAHPIEPFSLVFLDPPYGKGLAEKALASLRDGGWLTPGALVVVEEAKAAAFAAPEDSRSWSGARMTIRSSCFCAGAVALSCHARRSGASSRRGLGSSADASGILDHPLSRAMT